MNYKKLVLFLSILLGIFTLSITPVLAQSTDTTSTVCPSLPDNIRPAELVYNEQGRISDATDDPGGHIDRTIGNNAGAYMVKANSFFYGTACTYGATEAVKKMTEAERNNGALALMNKTLTQALYNPPTIDVPTHYANMLLPREIRSGVEFPAYAQSASNAPLPGSATNYLNDLGINKLWGISFSISMIGFVGILLYAGFMIMLRTRLGGQTVVTISMSLQNTVIGVFLALSSYALGGFFMNLSKYLVLVLASLMSGSLGTGFVPTFIVTPFLLVGRMAGSIDWSEAPGLTAPPLTVLVDNVQLATWVIGVISGAFVWFAARFIIAVMLFTAGFRIFFTVISTYVRMVIDIILAPIYFMASSLPGKQDGFMAWIRKMFKNSLVLPMIFMIVNLAVFVSHTSTPGVSAITAITGGAINMCDDGTTSCPNLSDMLVQSAGPRLLATIVILLMAPSASNILDELLGTQASKAAAAVADPIKKAAGSAPLIGGFFK